MVAQFPGVVYAERVAVDGPAGIRKTKKAITNAFQTQVDGLGYSIIEVLSPCPTNWKMLPGGLVQVGHRGDDEGVSRWAC